MRGCFQQLVLTASSPSQGKLKKIDLSGGGGSWSADSTIIFTPSAYAYEGPAHPKAGPHHDVYGQLPRRSFLQFYLAGLVGIFARA